MSQRSLPITKKTANKLVLKGLHDAWLNVLFATDERSEIVKPEYLSSAAVHRAFARFACKKGLAGQLIVRCEEATSLLSRKAKIQATLSKELRSAVASDPPIDSGRVDIGLFQGGGQERAFGVVEMKGKLSFTKPGSVDETSMIQLRKDLTRNVKYLKQAGLQSGVIYSAFGFFLYDKESVTKKDRDQFCKDKRRILEATARQLIGHNPAITVRAKVKSIDFESPAISSQGNDGEIDANDSSVEIWHTACGVISITTQHMP